MNLSSHTCLPSMPRGPAETAEAVEAITAQHMMVSIFNACIATAGTVHHIWHNIQCPLQHQIFPALKCLLC
jgi:hypothetical protein